MRAALQALEHFDDHALERVVRERTPETEALRYEVLRERRRAGAITEAEQQALKRLAEAADLLPLRTAYAAVLLTLRGQAVPAPDDLDA